MFTISSGKKGIIVQRHFHCGTLFFLRAFVLERIKFASVCVGVYVIACVQIFSLVFTIHVCLFASDLPLSVLILFVCPLQINGQDVQDREEAMAALSSDESRNIILLVARPEMQVRNDHTVTSH